LFLKRKILNLMAVTPLSAKKKLTTKIIRPRNYQKNINKIAFTHLLKQKNI